jgi:hypothetical protein
MSTVTEFIQANFWTILIIIIIIISGSVILLFIMMKISSLNNEIQILKKDNTAIKKELNITSKNSSALIDTMLSIDEHLTTGENEEDAVVEKKKKSS